MEKTNTSRAQIVATIGPASQSPEKIRELILAGMNLARLNFSWGTHDEAREVISTIKKVSSELNMPVPIIADLSGPRVQEKSGHEFNKKFEDGSKRIITQKDLNDLDFVLQEKVDYVAMSYVGSASDILDLKKEIANRGGTIPVIAKIERQVAVDSVDEIVAAADAIMVARGDLGNEVPLEKIPFVQDMIIKKSKKAGKPVITATQMLLSMVESPTPTRAEVTDVANAILQGSDAIMLSEESARGKYPVEAVTIMEKIALEAERHMMDSLHINSL